MAKDKHKLGKFMKYTFVGHGYYYQVLDNIRTYILAYPIKKKKREGNNNTPYFYSYIMPEL